MIFVILGTQDKEFPRLLEAIDKEIENGVITDKVVVQAGQTKYSSPNMEIFDLLPAPEFEKYIDKADLIITHGGVGSIISSLKKGKKVIVVPRLKKYDEHVNNHQLQIARRFEQEGYVKCAINLKNLEKVIKSMDKFIPMKYESDESNVVNIIENYIDNN